MMHRSGFAALVGRPNVGKSTLLNRLVGTRVSIVSHKPQTTRHRIVGLLHRPDAQIAFVDTPGLHHAAGRALNRQMNRAAGAAVADVDAVVWLVEPGKLTRDDRLVLETLKGVAAPIFVAVNKVDRVDDKGSLLPIAESLSDHATDGRVFLISARDGSGVEDLVDALVGAMPEGPPLYEPQRLTDRSEQFRVAELIREQVTRRLHQELPYAANVEVERLERGEGRVHVGAVIWVERESQKGIAIGRGGQTLKEIGTAARRSIAAALDSPVHLDLWVKVKRGWTDDDRQLREWGYVDP